MGDRENKPRKKRNKHATLVWGADRDIPTSPPSPEDSDDFASKEIGTTTPDVEVEDDDLKALRAKWEKRNAEKAKSKNNSDDTGDADKDEKSGDAEKAENLDAEPSAEKETPKEDYSRAKTLLAVPAIDLPIKESGSPEKEKKKSGRSNRLASKTGSDKPRAVKATASKAAASKAASKAAASKAVASKAATSKAVTSKATPPKASRLDRTLPGGPRAVPERHRPDPLNRTILGGPRVIPERQSNPLNKRAKAIPERRKPALTC